MTKTPDEIKPLEKPDWERVLRLAEDGIEEDLGGEPEFDGQAIYEELVEAIYGNDIHDRLRKIRDNQE